MHGVCACSHCFELLLGQEAPAAATDSKGLALIVHTALHSTSYLFLCCYGGILHLQHDNQDA